MCGRGRGRGEAPAAPTPSARRAFSLLYQTERAGVAEWIETQGAARDDAMDLMQEAFVRVWAGWERVEDPRAYLYEIVKNVLKDFLKHADIVNGCDDTLLPTPTPAPRPDEVLIGLELSELVEATVAEMADGPREVMRRYMDGADVVEIARERGTTPGVVNVQLHRARTALQEAIWHPDGGGVAGEPR